MAEEFRNKYRISSARMQNWDYGSNAAYFITICTQNRECYFGNIAEQKMELNNTGKIAKNIWYQIPDQFPYAEIGEFVVMPNHVHGILIINKPDDMIASNYRSVDNSVMDGDCVPVPVETRLIASLPSPTASSTTTPNAPSPAPSAPSNEPPKPTGGITGNKNPMIHQNISRIIRWYKGRCTYEIRKTDPDFGWQSRFHDHVIRDGKSYDRISNYILDNPKNWNADKFYDPQRRDLSRLRTKYKRD